MKTTSQWQTKIKRNYNQKSILYANVPQKMLLQQKN